jgi:ribosomal-protein-alanine N-acetyltransferase
MTEALKAFIEWTCKNKDVNGITAAVHKTNISSAKVLQNCGFKLVGLSDQEVFYCIKSR